MLPTVRIFFTLAALCCAALSLSACATTDPATGQTTVQLPSFPSVDQTTITEVQNAVTVSCGFLPTITTVADIVAGLIVPGGVAVVDIVSAAANGICKAVTAKGARRSGHVPTFRGVAIRGRFVR